MTITSQESHLCKFTILETNHMHNFKNINYPLTETIFENGTNQEFVFKWIDRADIIFHIKAHYVTLGVCFEGSVYYFGICFYKNKFKTIT
jgi:hypothetical protein